MKIHRIHSILKGQINQPVCMVFGAVGHSSWQCTVHKQYTT